MARLNEVPLKPEGIDPEKRKFVRNNNDLVRANHTQNKKIRDLEIETSRLRSENLCLREENLRLQHQLSAVADNVQLDEIASLQELLESRLQEINNAVISLGRHKRPAREKREPNPSTWKREVPILEVAGRARTMPSIAENSIYSPRLSIGMSSLQVTRLSDQSSGSPDLGPPPVAHFDYADPIKFDQPKASKHDSSPDNSSDLSSADTIANVESRRKRRETQMIIPPDAETGRAGENSPEESAPARVSAKRKIDVCEKEDQQTTHEMFSFTRKSLAAHEISEAAIGEILVEKPTKSATKTTERRVLGEKSVNMSPRKLAAGKKAVKKDNGSADEATRPGDARVRNRRPRVSTVVPVLPETAAAQPLTAEITSPPKTPAADLLSPQSEASSTNPRADSSKRDPETMANLEGMVRPSRRVRSVASYAEPSLNTKMRRSTVDMVDAVTAKASRNADTAAVKQEPADDGALDLTALAASTTMYQRSPPSSRLDSSIPRATSPTSVSEERRASSATLEALRRAERRRSAAAILPDNSTHAGRQVAERPQESINPDFKDVTAVPRRATSLEQRRARRHSSVSATSEVSSPDVRSSSEVSPEVSRLTQERAERPASSRSLSQPLGGRRRSMLV